MFASSSANVSQGGEKGEPDSDRHHRGICWGLQESWDEDSGRCLLRRAGSSSSWKTQRSAEGGGMVNSRCGFRGYGQWGTIPPRTQVRCQGYRMGSCLGTAANGLYDLRALKYDVAPEWPPLPQTPRHTLSLSCWQSCRETVKYTRASLSQGITHSTLCTWLTSRRWEPHSLGKNDKWIPEGRPGPQMQRAGGKGL